METQAKFKVDGFTINNYVIDVLYYKEEDTESTSIELDWFEFWDWCDTEYSVGKKGYYVINEYTEVDFQDWWDEQEQTPIIEKFINHQFSDGGISKQSINALKQAIQSEFNKIDSVGFPHYATQLITAARELGFNELADEMKSDLG